MLTPTQTSQERWDLTRIAEMIGGRISGDADRVICGAAPFESAGAGEITLAGSAGFLKRIDRTDAGAVIVPADFQSTAKTLVRVDNPHLAFARVMQLFHRPVRRTEGISPSAHVGADFVCGEGISIGPAAVIGRRVTVGRQVTVCPGAVIGDDVIMGDDVTIYPNVTVAERTRIGSRVIIQAGSVIGGDGFGYAPDGNRYVKIPHNGIVQIDDDVEIGAVNTIDRAKFGVTRIGRGVKTDNLVHIGHNVTVGDDSVIVAQVGISGSVTVGKHVILAGQAGVAQHLHIGDGATVGPQAGVTQSVPAGQVVSGTPEMPHRQWLRVVRLIPRLPELTRRLRIIEKRLGKIENHQEP